MLLDAELDKDFSYVEVLVPFGLDQWRAFQACFNLFFLCCLTREKVKEDEGAKTVPNHRAGSNEAGVALSEESLKFNSSATCSCEEQPIKTCKRLISEQTVSRMVWQYKGEV